MGKWYIDSDIIPNICISSDCKTLYFLYKFFINLTNKVKSSVSLLDKKPDKNAVCLKKKTMKQVLS